MNSTESKDFYRELAGSYDNMTRFPQRIKQEQGVLLKWKDRFRFNSALDAACGTGLHAILLSKMGVQTTGADISGEMLEIARQHAAEYRAPVKLIQSSMENLKEKIDTKFGAVFCLGNSLPHLLTSDTLRAALNNFSSLLNGNGVLAIQILNYSKILKEKNRIIGVHRKDDTEFIRFYDFTETAINFNILMIDWKSQKAQTQLITTELFPYQKDELTHELQKCGFGKFELYGNMKFDPYSPDTSPNLVLVSRKD